MRSVLLLQVLACVAAALPRAALSGSDFWAADNSSDYYNAHSEVVPLGMHDKRQNGKVALRILPLGASIMSGVGASDKAG